MKRATYDKTKLRTGFLKDQSDFNGAFNSYLYEFNSHNLDTQYLIAMDRSGYLEKEHELTSDVYNVLIDWTPDLGKNLWDQYIKKGCIETKDAALKAQLDILIFIIKRVKDYYGRDWTFVLRRTLLEGPEFTKYMKKSLDHGFNLHHCGDKSVIEGFVKHNSFEDYFPEYVLPFWKEECEDIRYSFLPCKEIPKKIENEYKSALREIIPKNINLDINLDRFLEHYSNSSSYLMSDNKTMPHLVQAWKTVPKIPKEYNCRRCEIAIDPGNIRDTVILEPDSLFAVEVFGQKILRLLRAIPQSLMGQSNVELERRVKHLLKRGKEHSTYRRDYKKEGLARPRHLLRYTLDVLTELYPGHFEDFYLFLRYNLRLNRDIPGIGQEDEILHPTRGTGLGMMNELVTLISIALYEMTLSRIETELVPNIRTKIKAGVWNDDSAFVGKYKYTDLFRQVDIQVHNDLDYILSEDKCVVLKNGSWILGFASSETYNVDKDYFFRFIIWSKFHCKNIVFAKNFIRSLTYPKTVMDTVKEFIANFGYEFYPEENTMPAAFGGWLKPRDQGMDTTLLSIDSCNLELLNRQYKAYLAEQERPSRMKLKRVDRLLKESEFRGAEFRFSFLSLELTKNKFFDFSQYFTDMDSLKKRLILSMTMRERSNDYWRIAARLRRAKYREKVEMVNLEIRLTNQYLDDQAGRLVALPNKWITKKCKPDYYCQYKWWFPEVKNRLDTVELFHRAQLRIEPENNKSVIFPQLDIEHLKQLDAILEPKADVYMEGMLPWSREISTKILEWCPNPFLWLNYYNRKKVEIRLCNIPTEISDFIILPKKPSYYFASPQEEEILKICDKYYDCLLHPKEALIWKKFEPIEIDLHGHKPEWTTPQYPKMMWKKFKKHKIDIDFDDTYLTIAQKYRACVELEKPVYQPDTSDYIIEWKSQSAKAFDTETYLKNRELLEDYTPDNYIEVTEDQPQTRYHHISEESEESEPDENEFYAVKISTYDSEVIANDEQSSREDNFDYLDSDQGQETTSEEDFGD
jgi:hypothetical protein